MSTLVAADTLIEVACPACGADRRRLLASEGTLGIAQCQRCRLVFTSPRLTHPQDHYLGERESIMRKYGSILMGEAGHNRDANYDQELRVIGEMKRTGRLLDVGSHCGFFLRRARGMSWELTGVEPSQSACELAREYFGLNIVQGTLSEAAFPDQSFDVVTLVDVFEHIDQPSRLLQEIGRVMKPNGVLFIKVPNVVYYLAKYRMATALGLQVEIFDAKEHVAHYSLSTLRRTLNRSGFRVDNFFVPRPIQDGAAWKRAARALGHLAAQIEFATNRRFGPMAMDLAVLAKPAQVAV